jgi:hypothetical protein
MRSKILTLAAATSLLMGSAAASAQGAQPLSLAASPTVERAGASMDEAGALRGRGWLLGIVALGILIFVITELSKENDLPNSP